ncbi:glycosyltransferase involved in cell wall biosynthesis [Balneicella halophila]|uniref:Glycosyltransferase involved in cell wall biosynthesis n=1 Tax=Balneicella halophila TaxID=1537566 RepID=A0A7L4UNM7_BALHA|nr:glycosyltransferase family 4 protein [Balneicella halophila]PVX49938.1 glycosyltransferase involved in cell wall biosynthesis [Balneicella halophila]
MKVLMFGWEFPPHISGGLGTACYGLTRGLSTFEDMDILFVVPKTHGDEEPKRMELLGAENVAIDFSKLNTNRFKKLQVYSHLVPYTSPDEYYAFQEQSEESQIKHIKSRGKTFFNFTGKYGKNLMEEISDYSIVAYNIAQEHDFDIIHSHDWLTYPAGIVAKEATGKPLVIHVHATDFDRSGGNVNPDVFKIEKDGMEAADSIITVSNLTRDTVIHKYGISPEKVTTVYNAVEPLKLSDNIKKESKLDEKIVTFLGRITHQKGPTYFIEAAKKVLDKTDNVRFVMAGSGDMMEKMIRHAASLGITDKFYFTGFLKGDDVFKMFYQSDVYVMPSVSEPFGISPLEAMQTDVPTIISYQSGVAEVVKHALKVNYWDTDALANAIYGLITYPSMAKTFKEFGRKEVESLKWENSAANVRDVYFKTLEKTNN